MSRSKAAVLAAALMLAPLGPAAAQAPAAAPQVGAPVRDASGEVLGSIESVTTDSQGRPVQVVVRTRGLAGVRPQSRALPVSSLRPARDGWTVPLRRSEFELLPPLKR